MKALFLLATTLMLMGCGVQHSEYVELAGRVSVSTRGMVNGRFHAIYQDNKTRCEFLYVRDAIALIPGTCAPTQDEP